MPLGGNELSCWIDEVRLEYSHVNFFWTLHLHKPLCKLSLPPMVLLCAYSTGELNGAQLSGHFRLKGKEKKLSSLSSVRTPYARFYDGICSLFLCCLSPDYVLRLPAIHWNTNCKWNRWQPVILSDSSGKIGHQRLSGFSQALILSVEDYI